MDTHETHKTHGHTKPHVGAASHHKNTALNKWAVGTFQVIGKPFNMPNVNLNISMPWKVCLISKLNQLLTIILVLKSSTIQQGRWFSSKAWQYFSWHGCDKLSWDLPSFDQESCSLFSSSHPHDQEGCQQQHKIFPKECSKK